MSDSPHHLMISGLDDADPYRMSAETRKEKYRHIREIAEADKLVEDFDIIYIDPSTDARINNSGRLKWFAEKAMSNPRKLFVVVIWNDKEEWEGLLENNIMEKLPNIAFHNAKREDENRTSFLGDVVDKWRKLLKG